MSLLNLYVTPFKVFLSAATNHSALPFSPQSIPLKSFCDTALSNLCTFSIVLTKRTEGFCGSLIGFLWQSYWISVAVLLDSCGSLIGFLWQSYWISVAVLLDFCGSLIGFLWQSYWISHKNLMFICCTILVRSIIMERCTLLEHAPYWNVHLTGMCTLLERAPYWNVHLTGTCTLLECAPYWNMHLTGTCTLLERAPYWNTHSY